MQIRVWYKREVPTLLKSENLLLSNEQLILALPWWESWKSTTHLVSASGTLLHPGE